MKQKWFTMSNGINRSYSDIEKQVVRESFSDLNKSSNYRERINFKEND